MKIVTGDPDFTLPLNDAPEDFGDVTPTDEENITGKRSSMRTSSLFYKVRIDLKLIFNLSYLFIVQKFNATFDLIVNAETSDEIHNDFYCPKLGKKCIVIPQL